jgi:hypothetical protein
MEREMKERTFDLNSFFAVVAAVKMIQVLILIEKEVAKLDGFSNKPQWSLSIKVS